MEPGNTFFAPPERASEGEIAAQIEAFSSHPILHVLLESVGSYLLILDSHRQILFANQEILNALNISKGEPYLGLRPGELLYCVHSVEGPAGCGTSKDCHNCAAVLSILSTQTTGKSADGVCHLCLKKNGQIVSQDLKVKTSRLEIGNTELVVLVLQDVTDEKKTPNHGENFLS